MAHLDTLIPFDFQPQDDCTASEYPEFIDYRKSSQSNHSQSSGSQPKRSASPIAIDVTVPCTVLSEQAGVCSCGMKFLPYTTPLSPPPTDPCLQTTIPLPYLSLRKSSLTGSLPSSCGEIYAQSFAKGRPGTFMPPTPPLSNTATPSSLPAIEDEPLLSCYDRLASEFYYNLSAISTSPLNTRTPNTQSTPSSSLSPVSPRSPLELLYPDSIHWVTLPCVLLQGNRTDCSGTPFMNYFHLDSDELHDQTESKDFIGFPGKLPLLSPLSFDQREEDCPSIFAPFSFCEDVTSADGGLLEGDSVIDDPCLLPPLPLPVYPDAPMEENEQCNNPQHLPVDPIVEISMQKSQLQSSELFQNPMHPHDDDINRFTCVSSPSLSRRISLPDLDDGDFDDVLRSIISAPSSPSLRCSSTLPEEEDTQSHREHEQSQSGTTSQLQTQGSSPSTSSLLALPGAETDDDLIPLCPSRPPSHDVIPSTSPSFYPERLLFDGDEFAHQLHHPGQRSPSPEPCVSLEPNIIIDIFPADEELNNVCDLFKRTRDAERAAMQLESIVESEEKASDVNASRVGSSDILGEGDGLALGGYGRLLMARKNTRKKQKMCRELATLLRLKLAEKGFRLSKDASGKISIIPASKKSVEIEEKTGSEEDKSPSDPRCRVSLKKQINSPHQLLVKMVLDRHETGYSDSGRRCIPSGSPFSSTGNRHRLLPSPLGKSCFTSTDVNSVLA